MRAGGSRRIRLMREGRSDLSSGLFISPDLSHLPVYICLFRSRTRSLVVSRSRSLNTWEML